MPKRIIPKSKTATQDRKQSFSSLKLSQGSQGSDLENISNEDKIAQFEVEVRWCIQQLENALKLGKLSPKQVKDHKVCLSTLKSSTSSMVQKRQVMSVSFGNYREKMAAEEKKIIREQQKVIVKPGTPSKRSVFLKKHLSTSSDHSFKFNFGFTNNDLVEGLSSVHLEQTQPDFFSPKDSSLPSQLDKFEQSNNDFRFNFNVETL